MKLTIQRSTLLHLRIPFSLYLMPVFCFAASQVWVADFSTFLIVFISIHFFLYPASNGFNSYYDKDEESIGGLENPPPVSRELLFTSLGFDVVAITLGLFFISWQFALMLFIYGLVSKAYSHDKIRLKKYPVVSLITAAVFQGGFTYLMTIQALQQLSFAELLNTENMLPAIVSSIMILGFYPMTQISTGTGSSWKKIIRRNGIIYLQKDCGQEEKSRHFLAGKFYLKLQFQLVKTSSL